VRKNGRLYDARTLDELWPRAEDADEAVADGARAALGELGAWP
jgi:hypothetical protein